MSGERGGCIKIHKIHVRIYSNRGEKILLKLYILATVRPQFSITGRSSKMRCSKLRQTHSTQVVLSSKLKKMHQLSCYINMIRGKYHPFKKENQIKNPIIALINC